MRITLNGQSRSVADVLTLSQLLAELDLGGQRIAVERNGEVVPKSRHPDTVVADGDRFEIIVAVGGG